MLLFVVNFPLRVWLSAPKGTKSVAKIIIFLFHSNFYDTEHHYTQTDESFFCGVRLLSTRVGKNFLPRPSFLLCDERLIRRPLFSDFRSDLFLELEHEVAHNLVNHVVGEGFLLVFENEAQRV